MPAVQSYPPFAAFQSYPPSKRFQIKEDGTLFTALPLLVK